MTLNFVYFPCIQNEADRFSMYLLYSDQILKLALPIKANNIIKIFHFHEAREIVLTVDLINHETNVLLPDNL